MRRPIQIIAIIQLVLATQAMAGSTFNGITRRAEAPEAWRGEASAAINSNLSTSGEGPGLEFTGLVGLGQGAFAEANISQAKSPLEKSSLAPAIGLGYRFLGDSDSALKMTAVGRYKTEGFSEMDGEIETALLSTYQRGIWEGTLGLAAGIEPDGIHRDGELSGCLGLRPFPGWLEGLEIESLNAFDGSGARANRVGLLNKIETARVTVSASAGYESLKTIVGTEGSGLFGALRVGFAF